MSEPAPGEVWMAVLGVQRRRGAVVLIRREGSGWRVVGLTTNPRYGDGTPRQEVPSLHASKRSFIWSPRTHHILDTDLANPVGRADDRALHIIASVIPGAAIKEVRS